MNKLLLIVLILILIPCVGEAQSPQVQWVQPNVQSNTQAQGYIYKLYLTPQGQGVLPAVVLPNVQCSYNQPDATCQAALPSSANQALISGTKSELTTTDPLNNMESAKSAPFFIQAAAPTSLRITP
jgi:hypothetical protein